MLLYHLKFAIRIFLKDKFFSSLNILGLTLGIGVSIILMLILQNDFSYDQHYARHERIYRLGAHYQITGTDDMIGTSARELGPILKDKFPEIEALARIKTMDHVTVKQTGRGEEKAFFEENVAQTDSSYFQVFNNGFIAGNARLCLADPHNVVITQSMAKKYFNHDDPLDKTLSINNEVYKVSGVIEDFPENAHLKFDFLLSGLPETREGWDVTIKDGKPITLLFWNPDVYTYLLMPENYNSSDFYLKFQAIYTMYFAEMSNEVGGNYTPILQPLAEIHFSGFLDDGPHGNLTYLFAFSGIGLMIVLLASINYMNLSTAKAVFVLLEKIKRDKNRVNIDKLDPTEITGDNLTGGYIVKIDKMSGTGGDGWTSSFVPLGRKGTQTIYFQYDYPKEADIVAQQKQYLKDYFSAFETALSGDNFKDPTAGYAKYIDINSFVDYFIANEVSRNPDAYRLSTFISKKKDSDGGKLYMGPIWDFNLGFGNVNFCAKEKPEGFIVNYNSICPDDFWLIPF